MMNPIKSEIDTIVVIPTYNEKSNITSIISAVCKALPTDVLVVDDDSPDGTAKIVADHFKDDKRVSVLSRKNKSRGLGYAYVEGFLQALDKGYKYIMQMDADFSHNPKDLPRLKKAVENADLAIGSRNVPGGSTPDWPLVRKVISRGGSFYSRMVLGVPIRDVTGGFKCWRSSALKSIGLENIVSQGFAFQIEMNFKAHRLGLNIVEVPIQFLERTKGKSKMSAKIFIEGLYTAWRIRWSK
jgi:dolichol-phosphate mannosyltransferase